MKKMSGLKSGATKAAGAGPVGKIMPVNLTTGRRFNKSEKASNCEECCGPYHQCRCPEFKGVN
jgi:hypothetical protein